jgi:TolB protein
MKRNFLWFCLAVVVIIGIYFFVNRIQVAQKPTDGPVESWSSYASPRFRVKLSYPSHWASVNAVDTDRYDGYNGFFIVSALGGGYANVDQALLKVVGSQLRPYGTAPTIEHLTVAGQDARLVLPSADQASELNHQAAFIVAYPRPIRYGTEFYLYAVLWADADHIRTIVSTFSFITPETNVLSTVSGQVVFDQVCLTTDAANSAKRAALCPLAPDAFKDRRVLVYDDTGKQLIKTLTPGADGKYSVELEAGNYVLDINYVGLDHSNDVPFVLKLDSGSAQSHDIVIDTGAGAPAPAAAPSPIPAPAKK